MRRTLALAAIGFLAVSLAPASAVAINSADSGVQLSTAKPHEVRKGSILHAKTGEKLGAVVRVSQGKRGYIEQVWVRDPQGVVRRVQSLSIYKRGSGYVTNLTKAQFHDAPHN